MNDQTHDEYGNRTAQPDQPPDVIYLQWYGDGDGNWPETDYGADVTWSKDRVYDGDICYVPLARAEAAERELATLRAQLAVEHEAASADVAAITRIAEVLGIPDTTPDLTRKTLAAARELLEDWAQFVPDWVDGEIPPIVSPPQEAHE